MSRDFQTDDEYPEGLTGKVRELVANEVARIGVAELAQRVKVDQDTIGRILAETMDEAEAIEVFAFYPFGDYPDLESLIRSYFHEDYDWDTQQPERWEVVVDRFAGAVTPGKVRGTADDILRLLNSVSEDKDIDRMLEEFGNYFPPRLVLLTSREWLQAIRNRLLAAKY
jgi:hypothetical protein